MFKRVTIIGLGLIGGSLGLAIKEKGLAEKVIGVSRRKTTLLRAKFYKAVDSVTLDAEEAVRQSDLVILAAPVLTIMEIVKHIAPHLPKNSILIDAGSTKEEIVKSIEPIMPKRVHFVGCHPLAGSEKSGIRFADKDLFKGTYCIITKTKHTDQRAFNKVRRFWKLLGMKTEIMNPTEHDRVVSHLSHLPHAAAVALTNAANCKQMNLAAGGFRDTTRIASGEPILWKDIFITNRKNIMADIKRLKNELTLIEHALGRKDTKELVKIFNKAKSIRDSI